MNETKKPSFTCDYEEGAHPAILTRLQETNWCKAAGYGLDEFSESARARIRMAIDCPDAEIHFLAGGTQANAVMIDALLAPYQGVIAAESGHVSLHEAGAIERTGHKVLAVRQENGKMSTADVKAAIGAWEDDLNREHMVMPGMVYVTHPTEFGTLYTLAELEEMSALCHEHGLRFYLDGARFAYALACPENDVALTDLPRLFDAFYLGGTKCGALLGEAAVFPKPGTVPHFFSIQKQHGALLAKGRLLGIQFDELFRDGLYERIGVPAIEAANRIRAALRQAGFSLCYGSPTNQSFALVADSDLPRLGSLAVYDFWEKADADRTIIRFCTSWATTSEDVDALVAALAQW
ncbi:MAG: aminotransferase class V-fold PLP-dependent enzyme [Coriobacteriia bacterium]|nr:aminotransferase class V-fold PLP-dependent enzyme [Coriobacteriia bacterium]